RLPAAHWRDHQILLRLPQIGQRFGLEHRRATVADLLLEGRVSSAPMVTMNVPATPTSSDTRPPESDLIRSGPAQNDRRSAPVAAEPPESFDRAVDEMR